VLTSGEGGQSDYFDLGGTIGGSFPVLGDSTGGALFDPQPGRLAQATAAFGTNSSASNERPWRDWSGESPTIFAANKNPRIHTQTA